MNRRIAAGITAAIVTLTGIALSAPAVAEEVSFKDKTITAIIGSAAGGGTDATGRLLAPFFTKHLPGNPQIIIRNMPGASGTTALNYIVAQTKPDGLTLIVGSSSNVDPLNYRTPQAYYNPKDFTYIGGAGRGGTMLVIRSDAEQRLLDKSTPPVVMGSIGGVPRSGMQITAWGIGFLGWNAKWVVGYRGTNELAIALERGEIEMTSTANMFQLDKFEGGKAFKVIYQSGAFENGKRVPRPEFPDVPLFSEAFKGKINDPVAQQAFDYWFNINAMDKWVAVLKGTPQPMVDAYRKALVEIAKDPEFEAVGKRISEDLTLLGHDDTEQLIGALAETPDAALNYMTELLASQGLHGRN
jgi:tripartite-type tricarboxylate transporter receptor subunit TctC